MRQVARDQLGHGVKHVGPTPAAKLAERSQLRGTERHARSHEDWMAKKTPFRARSSKRRSAAPRPSMTEACGLTEDVGAQDEVTVRREARTRQSVGLARLLVGQVHFDVERIDPSKTREADAIGSLRRGQRLDISDEQASLSASSGLYSCIERSRSLPVEAARYRRPHRLKRVSSAISSSLHGFVPAVAVVNRKTGGSCSGGQTDGKIGFSARTLEGELQLRERKRGHHYCPHSQRLERL